MSHTTSVPHLFLLAVLVALPLPLRADPPEVELVVGRWRPGEAGGRPARAGDATVHAPFGVDFQPDGTLIVVELEGGRVHTLDPDGRFTTIAGDGSKSYKGDNGPARAATFNGMHNLAITPDGAIYIADSWNHAIRRIDPGTGTITTVAGTGQPGDSGDGGPATAAQFDFVMCITLNRAGDVLYIADLNNRRIRKLDLKTGLVHPVAGNGRKGVPADGTRALDSPLVDPRAVAVDSRERVYILERNGHALRVVEPDGTIRTVAGTGQPGPDDGPALQARLNGPKHLCVDAHDRVWIADDLNAAVRLYDPAAGTLTTVLGHGRGRPAVDLAHPHGVTIKGDDLYVVDPGHDRILRLPGLLRQPNPSAP